MCAWRRIAIYMQGDIKKGTELISKTALNLAREYYVNNKLKRKDVSPTKLVEFEGIAKHHNVNIMAYEQKKDSGKDSGCWPLAHSKHGISGSSLFLCQKMDAL